MSETTLRPSAPPPDDWDPLLSNDDTLRDSSGRLFAASASDPESEAPPTSRDEVDEQPHTAVTAHPQPHPQPKPRPRPQPQPQPQVTDAAAYPAPQTRGRLGTVGTPTGQTAPDEPHSPTAASSPPPEPTATAASTAPDSSGGSSGSRAAPESADAPAATPPKGEESSRRPATKAEQDEDDLARRTRKAAQQPDTLRAAFRAISLHLKPLRVAMAFGLLLLVISAAVGLAQPLAVRFVLDKLAASEPLGTAVLILVGLVVASALCQGSGTFLMQRAAEDVVLSTRKRLIRKLLSVAVPEMRKAEPGDLMARVTSDTALIRQIALSSLVQLVTGTVMVVGAIVLMILLDWVLFLVTFGVVLVVGLLMGIIMPRIRRSSQQTQKNVGKMGSELERVLGAYTTVKASAAEDEERERLVDRMVKAHDSGIRTALWSSLAALTSTLAIQASFLAVLGFGGYRASTGAMEVPTLIAFLLYAMQLSAPVLQLTQAVSVFQSGRAALERIAEVDSFESEMDADPGEAPGTAANLGAVDWDPAAQFEQVTFSYPNAEAPALSDFTLTIPERGLTAIVGPSGSGKSSVLRLVEGFYPLDHGRVRVGGRDVVEWDLDELRNAVAYVEQESPTPAADVAGNLTYGLDDVDEQHAQEVLERVGLRERFAETKDQTLGHRGATLSGGERQRLALARALLRRPRLLLLDEATSALDAANEAMIRDLVNDVAREISVVVVAHRLSTIRDAGQIIVVENGKIRAHGTHEQLLAVDVLYASLVSAQDTLGENS
ncbi:ABC transporter ATP-binding protein [Blastococcus sp. Marseille-P5729]|uniref:ABC transporter ATP-binding protein n=1 Tax=Blastococcus sp. Marseille-P5729 TaxID=2086582 RepID=UPI00131DE278|nr:ABC transporter ATP-binding protein [Blastococcus sp. Marseille-P5729]